MYAMLKARPGFVIPVTSAVNGHSCRRSVPCRHLLPPPAPPAQCFYNLLLKLHCPQLRKGLNLITNRQNMRLLFDRHLHSDGDKPGLGAHTTALLTLALSLELSLQSSLRRSPPLSLEPISIVSQRGLLWFPSNHWTHRSFPTGADSFRLLGPDRE